MNVMLVRDNDQPTNFGVLTVGSESVQTVERPWIPTDAHPGGTEGISCVPVGEYALALHDSASHPKTFALVNHALGVYHHQFEVPPEGGRCEVLIHPANYPGELLGCIAPGLDRGPNCVNSSRDAFALIREQLPWVSGHTLTIRNKDEHQGS